MSGKEKHHYVPQFYLRRFCCDDDENKVQTFSKNGPYGIKKQSPISGIGYEDNLYTLSNERICTSIEKQLNRKVETPLTQSELWEIICNNKPTEITEEHKLLLYIFMRHMEYRSIERLEALKYDHARALDPSTSHDYSAEELDMHHRIEELPGGPDQWFLESVDNFDFYLSQYHRASIGICTSSVKLRTSTTPLIFVPRHGFEHPDLKPSDIVQWLPLTEEFGALLVMCDAHSDFLPAGTISSDMARVLNRYYLIQLWGAFAGRHMIYNDEYFDEDMEWAGLICEPNDQRKYKLPPRKPVWSH